MAATFDLWQQTYCLALIAGAASDSTGTADTLASTLQGFLSTFYTANTQYLGTWSTVWGPVVFQNNPSNDDTKKDDWADNAMYVAANVDKSIYVVSIAGTNFKSTYDQNDEDLAVDTTVAWGSAFPSLQPYSTPANSTPFLSTGTALGVNNLLGMVDTLQGTNQNIVDFLKSILQPSPPTPPTIVQAKTVIFTGHSLGGALAPTLALALFNSNGGPISRVGLRVYVYPTAGPTPGNADLAGFVSTTFPPVASTRLPYQVWNQNVCNTIDIVPQAWLVSTLKGIPKIYPQATWTKAPDVLTYVVGKMVDKSHEGAADNSAGAYTPLSSQPLTGTYNDEIPVSNYDSFKAQAAYQHTTAYQVLLGVTDITWEGSAGSPTAGFVEKFLTGDTEAQAKTASS